MMRPMITMSRSMMQNCSWTNFHSAPISNGVLPTSRIFSNSYASDIAAGRVRQSDDADAEPEVETGVKRPKVRPPAPATIKTALRGHTDAKEIKALMKSAEVSDPTGKTLHDLQIEERAYQARKRHAIEEAWKTNLDSRYDPMSENERYFLRDMFVDPDKAHQQELERIKRENAAFIPPDTVGYEAPKPATGFQVVSKRRRKSV